MLVEKCSWYTIKADASGHTVTKNSLVRKVTVQPKVHWCAVGYKHKVISNELTPLTSGTFSNPKDTLTLRAIHNMTCSCNDVYRYHHRTANVRGYVPTSDYEEYDEEEFPLLQQNLQDPGN